jgi:hypothetical protein
MVLLVRKAQRGKEEGNEKRRRKREEKKKGKRMERTISLSNTKAVKSTVP